MRLGPSVLTFSLRCCRDFTNARILGERLRSSCCSVRSGRAGGEDGLSPPNTQDVRFGRLKVINNDSLAAVNESPVSLFLTALLSTIWRKGWRVVSKPAVATEYNPIPLRIDEKRKVRCAYPVKYSESSGCVRQLVVEHS